MAVPGGMPLTDLQNRVWHLLRENGPDTGFAAPLTGDFNQTVVTRDLNIALGAFIGDTGLAPTLSDKTFGPATIVAGLDYALPADLEALTRIEYTPAGQYAYVLQGVSNTEWDELTGGSVPPDTGPPQYYRAPYGGKIRFSPQPGAGNVTAGDKITIYYSGLGTLLVNGADLPGLPSQFHMALVYRVLSDYWLRKQDEAQAVVYERRYWKYVERAKAHEFDSERSIQPSFASNDDSWDVT